MPEALPPRGPGARVPAVSAVMPEEAAFRAADPGADAPPPALPIAALPIAATPPAAGAPAASAALPENGAPRIAAADEGAEPGEEHMTEAELRASRARYRALCNLASDFFWETDAAHRVCLYIPGNGHQGALPRGAQIGKARWETPYLKPDAAGWRRHCEVLDSHRPFRDFEFSRPKQGAEAYFSISGEPMFDAAGAFIGYRGIGSEITAAKAAEAERLGLEEQLREAQKLASVGQLAAGVAHEINNPVGYVHSNFGTLERYVGELFGLLAAYEAAEAELPPASPRRAELARLKQGLDLDYLREDIPALMRESREGISRVRKIVADLKDFSRADGPLQWEPADLHRGIDSTLNIVANEIRYRADVVKRYGELPEVECMPSQLNQVFMNLLVNAAQAIEGPRGTITITTARADGGRVRIDVADTGAGIAAEHLGRIFDPFFTTKPVGKGTGLGLSLSYGIVQKHRGCIEVASEPGKGTTFSVLLPVCQEAAPAGDAGAAP